MTEHEQYAEDLALYALDALTAEDRAKIAAHLAGCASCRMELEQLRADTALLALTAIGPRPPQRARQRLLDAVAREPQRTVAKRAPAHRQWWGWLGWAATAALLVFAFSLWRQNMLLHDLLATADFRDAESSRELAELRSIAAPIIDPAAQRVTLVAAKSPPQPQGKAYYLKNRHSLVFLANNMPPLPSQKAYELWLIPTSGSPIPAGLFKPDASGNATVVDPPLPAGVEAKAFAITVENEAGSPAPTSPILMSGAGE
jgi:anti-sigma-K factor RskA